MTCMQDQAALQADMEGVTLIPVIWGSDKTTVSVATGQNDYYPLYASVGNLHNDVRRSQKGTLALVGFFPIPKSKPCAAVPRDTS
jgi:hypothetical protein